MEKEEKIFNFLTKKVFSEINFLNQEIEECKICGQGRKVIGSGNPLAPIFLLKKAPNEEEKKTGIAFSGETGKALNKAFKQLSIALSNFYSTNIIKCFFAEKNKQEATNCLIYLRAELLIVNPQIIVIMGFDALEAVENIFKISTKEKEIKEKIINYRPDLKILTTLNPDVALQNNDLKRRFWEDLKKLSQIFHSKRN